MATPADLPHHSTTDPDAATFGDGLGVRRVERDDTSGDLVEKLYVSVMLSKHAAALRERATRLANFRHPRFPRVRGVEVSEDHKVVAVVSDPVEGVRLSELIAQSEKGKVGIDVHAAIQVGREVLPALATLHGSRDVTHGTLAAERLILTKLGRVMVTDHALGAAIEKLQYPRPRLWKDYRIAMPPAAGLPRFDARADVAQVAIVMLELILGRSLTLHDFPDGLKKLIGSVTERLGSHAQRPMSSSLRAWFEQALPVDARKPLATALDAQIALEEAVKRERAYAPDPGTLRHLATRTLELVPARVPVHDAPSSAAAPTALYVVAPESPAHGEPAPPRRRTTSRKPAARRPTPEEEEAEEIAFLERELARLAAEEHAQAAPPALAATPTPVAPVPLSDQSHDPLEFGGPLGEAVVEIISETPRFVASAATQASRDAETAFAALATADAVHDATLVQVEYALTIDEEPAWSLTPPYAGDGLVARDADEAAVASVDRHSLWLDFESMHVSRQMAAMVASPAAVLGLAPRATRRSVAPLVAGAVTPVSAAVCTTIGTIADAARRYRRFAPAHAPFVRARDIATTSAPWMLTARSILADVAALAAVPVAAARPRVTRLARAITILPLVRAAWRRPVPAVAALAADTLHVAAGADVDFGAADVAIDFRIVEPDASERFARAAAVLTSEVFRRLAMPIEEPVAELEAEAVTDEAVADPGTVSAVAPPPDAVAEAATHVLEQPSIEAFADMVVEPPDTVRESIDAAVADTAVEDTTTTVDPVEQVSAEPVATEAFAIAVDEPVVAWHLAALGRPNETGAETTEGFTVVSLDEGVDTADAIALFSFVEVDEVAPPDVEVTSCTAVASTPDGAPVAVAAVAPVAPVAPIQEMAHALDESDPAIAALLRELDALEAAEAADAAVSESAAPEATCRAVIVPARPPAPAVVVELQRAEPHGVAAGLPASPVLAAPVPVVSAPESVAAVPPPVTVPVVQVSAQEDTAVAAQPETEAPRKARRNRGGARKKAKPEVVAPAPVTIAGVIAPAALVAERVVVQVETRPPAPQPVPPVAVPARIVPVPPASRSYAPWEVPESADAAAARVVPATAHPSDVARGGLRSSFMDAPMPAVVTPPPAEPPAAPVVAAPVALSTHVVPAPVFEAPSFATSLFATGEHEVLAPASPVFGDDEAEPVVRRTKVHRFPVRFDTRKINWRRTLAASLLLMLLEGAGFAAVYWFTQPKDVGYLNVRSSVEGLEVRIDGKAAGKTPLAVELHAGRHTIEMSGFGLNKVLPVEIASGVQTTQMVKWPRGQKVGTLQIASTPPGARVIIDGEMRGVTPVTIEGLSDGGHTLVLESDAGRVRQGVRVVANESTDVNVGIFAGWLNVFAPVQVRVFEDGKLLGTSEDGKLLLPPGEHRLELINPQLGLRQQRTVEVTPGNTTTLSLDAPDGSVVIDAPDGTEVWIDGQQRGVTPMAPLNAAVGTREVILRHPQIGQRRFTVQVGVKAPARAEFFTP